MTDRTCLDVAADALFDRVPTAKVRAALDAIHPALADLTPDDVAALFRVSRIRVVAKEVTIPRHAWDVLYPLEASRD